MSNAAARRTVLAAVILTAAFCFASSFIGLNQPSPPTIAATPPRAAAAEDAAPPKEGAPSGYRCQLMATGVRSVAGWRDMGERDWQSMRDYICLFLDCDGGAQAERTARGKWSMDLIHQIYRTPKMTPDQEVDWYLNTYCGEDSTSK